MKKIFVITGGNSGMGYEISKKLLKSKHHVFILSRKAEQCDLRKYDNCHTKNVDISKIGEILKAKKWIAKILGDKKIDVLVNCAGVGFASKLEEITEKQYENFFSTNVKGMIFTTQIFFSLIKKGAGIICNFSSIAGIKGFAEWSVYCASKFAVEGYSQSIRQELRKSGIRVMSIRPGAVDTPFYHYLSKDQKKEFIKPQTIAEILIQLINLPKEVCVEDIFINNSVGDL